MAYYLYDQVTGEYLGIDHPQPHPFRLGEVIPAGNTTEIEPPTAGAGDVAVYRDGVWSIAQDHRGETWFRDDGTEFKIVKLGDPADDGLLAVAPVSPPDMPAERVKALNAAMAYGNAITGGELSQWAGIEPLSWTQQRDEALVVVGGGALDGFAVLPGLAEDKGVTLAAYAEDVLANAARYQAILCAAVHLRRTATARLTDEAIDTTDKLDAAVAALRAVADALAAQLIAA